MAGRPPAIIELEAAKESINAVLYGDSGVGKTTLGGSANTLFLATENGTIAAKRQGSKAKLWKINEWDDLQDAYDYLEENPDHGFEWVVIDSITKMQTMCMRQILDVAKAENPSRDIDVPQIQDWGKYYNMFTRFRDQFNDLPVNVLWVATTMRVEDENGDELVLPELNSPNKAPLRESMALCASADVVMYLEKKTDGKAEDAKTTRRLLFEQLPPYFAKDRYAAFPRWVKLTEGDQQLQTLESLTNRIYAATGQIEAPAPTPAKRPAPARRPATTK